MLKEYLEFGTRTKVAIAQMWQTRALTIDQLSRWTIPIGYICFLAVIHSSFYAEIQAWARKSNGSGVITIYYSGFMPITLALFIYFVVQLATRKWGDMSDAHPKSTQMRRSAFEVHDSLRIRNEIGQISALTSEVMLAELPHALSVPRGFSMTSATEDEEQLAEKHHWPTEGGLTRDMNLIRSSAASVDLIPEASGCANVQSLQQTLGDVSNQVTSIGERLIRMEHSQSGLDNRLVNIESSLHSHGRPEDPLAQNEMLS